MLEVSYSEARGRLAELLDRVAEDREVVRIRRQGGKPAAVLVDADEYASLEETAYLLSSPANVRHLLRALAELEVGQGRSYESVEDLWRDLGSAEEPRTAAQQQPTVTLTRAGLNAALRESMEDTHRDAVERLQAEAGDQDQASARSEAPGPLPAQRSRRTPSKTDTAPAGKPLRKPRTPITRVEPADC